MTRCAVQLHGRGQVIVVMKLGGKGCRSRCIPHQIGERCHENASDCLRLDRCGGDAGDTSTCRLFTRLPSRRTMPGVLRSVPAILWSAPAILWSIALLCPAPAILRSAAAILWSATSLLRLRLGQPNHSVILALLTVLTMRVPETPPFAPYGGILVVSHTEESSHEGLVCHHSAIRRRDPRDHPCLAASNAAWSRAACR